MRVLIKNGNVVLENTIILSDILIENNKIVRIDKNIVDKEAKVIDATNKYVTPGFIDIHTHGGAGHDYMEATEEAYIKITNMHIKNGTTSVIPTTIATGLESTVEFLKKYKTIKDSKNIKMRLLGLHLEGPYLSSKQKGAMPEKFIRPAECNEYMKILNASDDIKIWTIAPEVQGALELGKELEKRNIIGSIGHSDAEDQVVFEALNNGFKSVTHLYSMTSTIIRRNCYRVPGINEAAFISKDLYTEAICDGHHLPDTLIRLIYQNKGPDRMVLVTDSMSAAGLGNGEFYLGNPADNHKVLVKDGVAFMPDMSSFAGSVSTSHQLLKTVLNIGIDFIDCIKMMTITPSRLIKMDNIIGSIEEGKYADIVIMNKDYEIDKVLINGEVVSE